MRAKSVSADAVKAAMREYDIDPSAFLARHGFGPARRYEIVDGIKRYPSKAIYGVAHELQYGESIDLEGFKGGVGYVVPRLRALNFNIPDPELDSDDEANASIIDRLRKMVELFARPQQADFRKRLISAYGEQCQFTGCKVMAVVQACHIRPVAVGGSDETPNGILLRIDVHTLYDMNFIGIDPSSLCLHINSALAATDYAILAGRELIRDAACVAPSNGELRRRWSAFKQRSMSDE